MIRRKWIKIIALLLAQSIVLAGCVDTSSNTSSNTSIGTSSNTVSTELEGEENGENASETEINIETNADTSNLEIERAKITLDFVEMIEKDEELRSLVEKSIYLAKVNNQDKTTNPVQSLDEYYDFLDWCSTCMPWNILDTGNPSLYSSIDQSLDYFYYLLDQPLPELAGKG